MKNINNMLQNMNINSSDRIKNMIEKSYKNRDEKGHTNSTQIISGNLKLEVTFREYDDYYDLYFNNNQILSYDQNEKSTISFIDFEKIGNLKNFNNLLTGIDDNIINVFLKYLFNGIDMDSTLYERFDDFYNNILLKSNKENTILGQPKEKFLEIFLSKLDENNIMLNFDVNDYLEGFGIKNKFKYGIFNDKENVFLEIGYGKDEFLKIGYDLLEYLNYDLNISDENEGEDDSDTIDLLEEIHEEKGYKIKVIK